MLASDVTPPPTGGSYGPYQVPDIAGRTAMPVDRFFVHDTAGPPERPRLRCGAGHWLVPFAGRGESRWAETPDLPVGHNPAQWKPP